MCAVSCCELGISWLPGLPSQVLQAVGEVLETPCFNRLLAACLTQQGEPQPGTAQSNWDKNVDGADWAGVLFIRALCGLCEVGGMGKGLGELQVVAGDIAQVEGSCHPLIKCHIGPCMVCTHRYAYMHLI